MGEKSILLLESGFLWFKRLKPPGYVITEGSDFVLYIYIN